MHWKEEEITFQIDKNNLSSLASIILLSNEFFISAWKVTDLYGCKIFLYSVINMCLNKIKFGIQSIYFTIGGGWGNFSRKFPIWSFHKLKKFPLGLFSNLKFIWNFKMERILLVVNYRHNTVCIWMFCKWMEL